jgi:IS30 family transposase
MSYKQKSKVMSLPPGPPSLQQYQTNNKIKTVQFFPTTADIAKIVNKSTSTISRELKRNIPKRGRGALVYAAENARCNI